MENDDISDRNAGMAVAEKETGEIVMGSEEVWTVRLGRAGLGSVTCCFLHRLHSLYVLSSTEKMFYTLILGDNSQGPGPQLPLSLQMRQLHVKN